MDVIERGLADTRASRVFPRETMTAALQALLGRGKTDGGAAPATAGERPVVWALTARDTVLEIVRTIAETDAAAGAHLAERFDQAGKQLAIAAHGRPGRLAFTYETAQAVPPYTLAFEIVTWQKAGDVIAILAVVADADTPIGFEAPIVW
ncbi:type II toxin-antitoxin system RelE/ParE family toxin [Beijerinckia sp. L45]|uniref:type II toxin-antitoxin system RelE/ParE family toxin n=1 Tax=Beijerinckia sp. L45 TaxID=1641855 RepID=UPI00131DE980|nr:type II toxin-antitoxin system RelE/ParE family toxin [Beijerinckia sp. L45]